MHSPRPWPLTTSLNRNSSITLSPPALQQQIQQHQQTPPTSPTAPESRRAPRPAPLSPTKAADAREIPAPPLSPTPTLAVGVGARLQDKTHLFLSTQRTQYATRTSTARTLRFLLRVAQLAGGLMALTALYVATFDVNYTSTAIGLSGVNLASLTSVTSVVVSLTHLVTLLFPAVVGIVPARERHVSPVELALDGIYAGLWGIAAGMQAAYGSCPRYLFRSAGANSPEAALFAAMSPAEQAKLVNVDCLPWNLCWAFGFGLAALYLMSASLGVKSWRAARAAERREFMFM
ncbi:hypothetical protein AMAG_03669 [Allomyces macrogynus ATCC 38327]|uniref:MARVEL domain-containing protein n=1 Tax=Allomyces macrogynus (strain ATCC 38327) TaxID=578462 RepID=A0A0L0S9V7_ALLM3|nr:hypothetical protein AMAG_03669 [Allomyces macrogynus ATCC 38327]|eukprot:KNE59383.1 hypothetical protein AMAG_03669 [Allomyces macrogynus ATCC 38327]